MSVTYQPPPGYPHHQPPPYQRPAPHSRRHLIVACGIVAFVALTLIVTSVLTGALTGADRTPKEEAYLAALTVAMDEDLAVRAGHAACDLIPTTGTKYAREWLAGVDDFSQLGAVKSNPHPLSATEAIAVVKAAVAHLCAPEK